MLLRTWRVHAVLFAAAVILALHAPCAQGSGWLSSLTGRGSRRAATPQAPKEWGDYIPTGTANAADGFSTHPGDAAAAAASAAAAVVGAGGSTLPDAGTATAAKEQSRALWLELESKGKMSACWKRSLAALQSECAVVNAKDALRSRLALAMAACDSEGDGRGDATAFRCGSADEVRRCVRGLSEPAYALFVQYRLHTDVLCAYLQEELFHQRTAAAVAALHTAAADSARSMASLTDSSGRLLSAVREGQAAQQQTQRLTAELQTSLGTLQAGQTEALTQLQISTTALHTKTEQAGQAMSELQSAVTATGAEAAGRLHALRDLAVEHYDALERRTSGLLHVLGRVEEVQRTLAERSFTTQELVKFASAGIAVLLCTTPQRTATARLPALAVLLVGWLGPLLVPPTVRHVLPWFVLSVGGAAALIALVARAYRSPSSIQRQMLREELLEALARFHVSPQHFPRTHPSPWSPPPRLPIEERASCQPPHATAAPAPQLLSTPFRIHHEGDEETDGDEDGETSAARATVRGADNHPRTKAAPRPPPKTSRSCSSSKRPTAAARATGGTRKQQTRRTASRAGSRQSQAA